MLNNFYRALDRLNQPVLPGGIFGCNVVLLTCGVIVFDLFQLATSQYTVLALVSLASAVLGAIGLFKLISHELSLYVLAYLLPCFQLALGAVFSIYHVGVDASTFSSSGVLTAYTTLGVPVVAAVTTPVILAASKVSCWLVERA